ncbi:MAG: hypothetical protein FJY85_19425 [Deltaproteobacteria bacterium]|nr:hypothetical protein [Deltaproteobacteria bacterium]
MAARYTDPEIQQLLVERKPLVEDYRKKLRFCDKRGHREAELGFTGAAGNEFRIIARQNSFNVLDFSIMLAVCPPDTNQLFRLRRHNGKSHEHTNQIEGRTFYDFHIHMATERYQDLGMREDAYAQPTDRFGDFEGALRCLLDDCAFELPPEPQGRLFDEREI